VTTNARTRRGGFTLIELIVTIALIAVLVALTAGAILKVRNTAQDQAATATLTKLNTQFDKRWSAVLDTAAEAHRNNKIPDPIMTAAGGDRDLARVLWTHMLLRNEFPTTFQEARATTVVNGYTLPPRAVFASLPNLPVPNPATPAGTNELHLQSAICLYIALVNTGNRGETMNLEGIQAADVEYPVGSGTTFKVFQDAWGMPISFCRMTYTPEVNTTPHARPGAPATRNMADPLGKLARWPKASQLLFWNLVTANHLPYTWNVPGVGPQTFPSGFAQTGFPYDVPGTNPPTGPWNWVPTLISAGPNKQYHSATGTTAYLFGGSSTDDANDNVLSFRLRHEGNRGD
jgi:prepilin-type N-terminal cleavage/methylation domain-containing protein